MKIILRIWNDSVFSQVIAYGILAVFGFLLTKMKYFIFGTTVLPNIVFALFLVLTVVTAARTIQYLGKNKRDKNKIQPLNNYNEGDKKSLLKEWVANRLKNKTNHLGMIKYSEIDTV